MKLSRVLAVAAIATSLLQPFMGPARAAEAGGEALAPEPHYNEIFTDSGDVRPHYRDIYRVAERFSRSRIERIHRGSRRDFRDDNMLNHLPRILLDGEFDGVLKRGVDQRGRALRAFLVDHYSGARKYLAAGLIPPEVLERIISRSLEAGYQGALSPELISFIYGPDVIRDNKGVFRVVEDNSGFVGGLGDLKLAIESLLRQVPEYQGVFEYRDPMEFYRKLISRYRARADGGRVAILMIPPYADNEDARIRRLLGELDVDIITPHTNNKLRIEDNGVFVERSSEEGGAREKIGFLILNGEHWWLDMNHPITKPVSLTEYARIVASELRDGGIKTSETLKRKFLAEMAKTNRKTGFPNLSRIEALLKQMGEWEEYAEWRQRSFDGLMDAILSKKVATNFSPGTNFTNDKEFYLYVEEMIRFYLKEEPILRNIETHRVGVLDPSGRIVPDEALLKSAEQNQHRYVIKPVDGRGGDGIAVGPKVSKEEFVRAIQRAREEPARSIVQRYTPLSILGGDIVDVRLLSDVGPRGKIFVSDTPWGRSLPLKGDGKVNLSAQGRETAVVVVKASRYCHVLFEGP